MPEYRSNQVQGTGGKFGIASKYLNLQRVFNDAVRQNQWKMEQDWRNNQSGINQQKISTAGHLAGQGMQTPDQFRQNTSYQDPYSGQKVPGMELSSDTSNTKMSPILENAKNKRVENVMNIISDSNDLRYNVDLAFKSADKLTAGLKGKVTYAAIKNLDANNPILEDWQNLKAALTQAQIMASGPLKGAISDTEERWLAQATANDDLISVPRARSVLAKLQRSANAKEKAVVSSYKRIYGEDPYTWEGSMSNMSDFGNGYSSNSDKENIRAKYNALRESGVSAAEAKKRLGL